MTFNIFDRRFIRFDPLALYKNADLLNRGLFEF